MQIFLYVFFKDNLYFSKFAFRYGVNTAYTIYILYRKCKYTTTIVFFLKIFNILLEKYEFLSPALLSGPVSSNADVY